MAENIQYDVYVVSGSDGSSLNNLVDIGEEKKVDVDVLLKLNPNIKSRDEKININTQVLCKVGSITDNANGFEVGTLRTEYINGTGKPGRYKVIATDIHGNEESITVDGRWYGPVSGGVSVPDLSLDVIIKNADKLYKTKKLELSTLMSLNPGKNQMEYLGADHITLLEVAVAGSNNKVGIDAYGILVDTTRTCYVRWNWNHEANHTSGVTVKWEWQSSDGKWWTNKKDVTDTELFEDTYSPDEAAVAVQVSIKPIESIKSTLTSTKFQWSDIKPIEFGENWAVATPSDPSVEIKVVGTENILTATYDSLPVETLKISYVQFRVIKDDSIVINDENIMFAVSEYGHVEFSHKVEAGHRYRVQARCCKKAENSSKFYYSNWSPGDSNITNTLPTAPFLVRCRVISNNTVEFTWEKVNSADTYNLQYIIKDPDIYKDYHSATEYFESMDTKTEVQINATTVTTRDNALVIYKRSEIENGEYLVRVNAANESQSRWSRILSFILGRKPNSPTTSSSATSVFIGEPLTLYWTHNSEDGSKETSAQIELILNDDDENPTIITLHRTTDNTLNKFYNNNFDLFRKHGISISAIQSLNGIHDRDAILEPGTLLRTNADDENYYIFVTDEDDEETSYFKVNTESYNEGAKIDWRVRTAGILKDSDNIPVYGDWSIKRTVDVYGIPELSVELLDVNKRVFGNILTSLPFYVSLKVRNVDFDHQTPTGYHINVVAKTTYDTTDEVGNDKKIIEGSTIFSKYYDVTDITYEIPLSAKDLTFENNQEYSVNCTVSMSSGLTKERESIKFKVSGMTQGYEPQVEIGIDKDSLTAIIRPYVPNVSASDAILSVYRREFDGSFTEIVPGLLNNAATYVVDPHPALDYARYRIIAQSVQTGVIRYLDISEPVDEHSVVIQWDEKWNSFDVIDVDSVTVMENADKLYNGNMLKLPYNIDVSNTHSPDVSLVRYIGRKRPVSYYGTQRGEAATWNMEIPKSDKETLYALRRLAIYMGNVYVREPSGSGYWASINISFSQKHLDVTIPVTINITPVEGGM